jgi:thiol-disulfide isomerase/thioredoxin
MLTNLAAGESRVLARAMERNLPLSMGETKAVSGYSRRTMQRLPRFLASLCVCACLAAPALAKRAPDPGFKSLDGQQRKLSSLRGQIVVVNFWATWCGPCQEELPRLAQIAASYEGKPVKFVTISIDAPKDRSKIPGVLERLKVPPDSWVGGDTDMLADFGLGNIVPGTAVLDEHGEVIARIMGEAREADVRTAVDWLLGGRTGPAPAALTKRY